MPITTTIDVVSAVILSSDISCARILLTQRLPSKNYPYTWESAGGKVAPGELHHVALARELDEELKTAGDIAEAPLWQDEWELPTGPHRLSFYRVTNLRSPPVPQEGQGIGWFTAEELGRLTLAPGNERALDRLTGLLLRSFGQRLSGYVRRVDLDANQVRMQSRDERGSPVIWDGPFAASEAVRQCLTSALRQHAKVEVKIGYDGARDLILSAKVVSP